MRIEVKGRNTGRSRTSFGSASRSASRRSARQVSPLAQLEVELSEERNPSIADSQIAEVTLRLKGMTLRARERHAAWCTRSTRSRRARRAR